MSEPTYRPATGADRDELARFLTEHQWPFHARARLSPTEAAGVVAGWDLDGESTRIAEDHRGAGIGTAAVRWLSGQVFGKASSTTASATPCCARTGSGGRPPRSTGTATSA